MKVLADTKERALKDPERFETALKEGRIRMRGDELYNPSGADEDDSDEEMEGAENAKRKAPETQAVASAKDDEKWGPLPTPQNVVRMPPINWEKYGVVGDSLEKIHKDQVARPVEGMPQKMGPDGRFQPGPDGQRREYSGVAAPYNPLKDRIEKANMKKGGKRSY